MKAIAWDDKPDEYMVILREYFVRYHIDLEIVSDPDDFVSRFTEEQWSFVVLDYINAKPKEGKTELVGKKVGTGVKLAKQISNRNSAIPIFMVTAHLERAVVEAEDLPPKVSLRSKNTSPAWMAGDIVETLRREGLYSKERRVFLICGRDCQSKDATEKTHKFLGSDLALDVIRITPSNLVTALADGLVDRMRDCRAVVAICTPDDEWTTGGFYPRLNVVLEMGIAMGLGGGVDKLCVLKREGSEKQLTSNLPSDLGGVLYISFGERIEDSFPRLRERLITIGVKVK